MLVLWTLGLWVLGMLGPYDPLTLGLLDFRTLGPLPHPPNSSSYFIIPLLLFFKSTSGMKKCARGGLVSNFSWKFMEIIVICIISDWIWIKCSLGAGFEEARNSSAFHLIFQLLGQILHRIIIKHKISLVIVLSCMNVILRVFRFGHYLRH